MLTTNSINSFVIDSDNFKKFRSPLYNYEFNKNSGFFARWGTNFDNDPLYAPSPEILDLEISINGCKNNCKFCYKGNSNSEPTNMSFETFRKIVSKFPKSLTQIAFGITGVKTNPDFVSMLDYSKNIGIIPNFTLSGIDLDDNIAKDIVKYIGAVAVSIYENDKNIGYDTVELFTKLGIKQTNIHLMISNETKDFVNEVVDDVINDKRLKDLNAVVFLSLKPKGRAKDNFNSISNDDFSKLIFKCFNLRKNHNFNFGFDSCTAPAFENFVNCYCKDDVKKQLIMMSESCESSLFSSYINVYGEFFPCSFSENEYGWEKGIDVVNCNDFIPDVWYNERVVKFRNDLLNTCKDGCRNCVMFDLCNKV